MNTWEDERITDLVKDYDRKKIVIAALWTEICGVGPARSAIDEGYEVYFVTDAYKAVTNIDSHPRLAGQNPVYLESALKAYRKGNRRGDLADIMRQNARGLSDQEIRALAAYYASL